MQEIELKPSTSRASSPTRNPPINQTTSSSCLSALRHSTAKRLSQSPTRILQSNTNPLDRGMEVLLFREILACKSLSYIADNLSRDGVYNNATRYPEAYTYLLSGRPRLTADQLLCHVLWRLDKSKWCVERWESALFGNDGKEGLAWALVRRSGGRAEEGERRRKRVLYTVCMERRWPRNDVWGVGCVDGCRWMGDCPHIDVEIWS